jgi:L-threonylcarbamoyladenylate synthase
MIVLSSVHDPRLPQLLLDGKVGVIPTDTIYGLVTVAANKDSVDRLYSLKKRYQKLGTFMAANPEQLLTLGLVEEAVRAAAHLWPNPISVVVPTHEGWEHLDLGKQSLAVRIPKDDALLALLETTGPLATSSANLFGQPPANTIEEAMAYFGDQVDFYVDGGERQGAPSTIVRYQDGRFETLRQGSIIVDEHGQIVDNGV